ncbi:uncharacterized protein KQ657_000293 [Scheffersomyces spartinae]|uniref:Carboxymuconolactone decarboxylase-like domain-containing protein n=1 Tax=Scheffersomyces spartinae TaxID=45513 RepID=A0A9P8AKX2_9ASCO|nr:uncharacterized protein KQ657_000293 [Scheffersomyces spartinae]KAG7196278.1 hypothetical protein KQ657_000293 [Scheffersomyces spartinae]
MILLMLSIVNPERLVRLAYKYPSLRLTWYIVACAALTVVNQPEEIPKVFHFALRQQLLEHLPQPSLLTDSHLLQLASDSISSLEKFAELSLVGVRLPDVLIPYTYHDKFNYKYTASEDIKRCQEEVARKIRECILKSSALSGLPKAINALMILKSVTPTSIRPSQHSERPLLVVLSVVEKSSDIVQEDVNGTKLNMDDVETIDGIITTDCVNATQIQKDLIRGSEFWNTIYTNKINTRIRKQMINAYPDLWQYTFHHVYAPLLSFTDVLTPPETLMCVVACLIPQDVNPQLKGHLKGAINVGVTKQELNDLRSLVFDICDWSGGTYWRNGKESVAKL